MNTAKAPSCPELLEVIQPTLMLELRAIIRQEEFGTGGICLFFIC